MALAVVEQLKTVLWLFGAAAIILGFKFSTPGQELSMIRQELAGLHEEFKDTNGKLADMQQQVSALVRLSCEARPRDAQIARLNCNGD